jgi:hypothetical protein
MTESDTHSVMIWFHSSTDKHRITMLCLYYAISLEHLSNEIRTIDNWATENAFKQRLYTKI